MIFLPTYTPAEKNALCRAHMPFALGFRGLLDVLAPCMKQQPVIHLPVVLEIRNGVSCCHQCVIQRRLLLLSRPLYRPILVTLSMAFWLIPMAGVQQVRNRTS